MIALATVRPPTPESKMPIGAVFGTAFETAFEIALFETALPGPAFTRLTLPGERRSGADRRAGGAGGPPAAVRSAHHERGQQAAERAEQVRLPGNGDHTGDVRRGDPDDPGPEQPAVQREQHHAERDVLP